MEPSNQLTEEDLAHFEFVRDTMPETHRLAYSDMATMVTELYEERIPMIMEAIEKGASPMALMVALAEHLPEFPQGVFQQFVVQVLIEVATRELIANYGKDV